MGIGNVFVAINEAYLAVENSKISRIIAVLSLFGPSVCFLGNRLWLTRIGSMPLLYDYYPEIIQRWLFEITGTFTGLVFNTLLWSGLFILFAYTTQFLRKHSINSLNLLPFVYGVFCYSEGLYKVIWTNNAYWNVGITTNIAVVLTLVISLLYGLRTSQVISWSDSRL